MAKERGFYPNRAAQNAEAPFAPAQRVGLSPKEIKEIGEQVRPQVDSLLSANYGHPRPFVAESEAETLGRRVDRWLSENSESLVSPVVIPEPDLISATLGEDAIETKRPNRLKRAARGVGGWISERVQSFNPLKSEKARYITAAASILLPVIFSACQQGTETIPTKPPATPNQQRTVEPDNSIIPPTQEPTNSPTQEVTNDPTEDSTETRTPKATETAQPTDTPKPTRTPKDTPTPEKTPETTPKPENPFTQEFWDGIFENFDKIDWVALNPIQMDKEKLKTVRSHLVEYTKGGDYKMFLRQILGISYLTEKYDDKFQWTNNPPEDFATIQFVNDEDYMKKLKDLKSKGVMAETLEHLILRTRIVGPIVENLKLLWGADSSKFEQIQILLEETPIDWNSDRIRYKPYKPFIDKLDEILKEEGTQFIPEDQKSYLAFFKLTLIFNDPVKAIDSNVQFFCDQNNGSDQDKDMRDKFITPFLQMMLEQDFSTRIKDKVEGFLSRCVVN